METGQLTKLSSFLTGTGTIWPFYEAMLKVEHFFSHLSHLLTLSKNWPLSTWVRCKSKKKTFAVMIAIVHTSPILSYLQLRKMNIIPLVYKPYVNETMFVKEVRSFRVSLCGSIGCTVTSFQNWRFEKNSATLPTLGDLGLSWAERQNFFQTSIFESL